jgi:hypothetical protein
LLTAARFERLGHLYALRYRVAIECVMTATDNRNAIALKEFLEGCRTVPAKTCVISIFGPSLIQIIRGRF